MIMNVNNYVPDLTFVKIVNEDRERKLAEEKFKREIAIQRSYLQARRRIRQRNIRRKNIHKTVETIAEGGVAIIFTAIAFIMSVTMTLVF